MSKNQISKRMRSQFKSKSINILIVICIIIIFIIFWISAPFIQDNRSNSETRVIQYLALLDDAVNDVYIQSNQQYDYIQLSQSEIDMITKLVWLEARSECDECKLGIISVIINRSINEHKSISEIIYEDKQFSLSNKIYDIQISNDDMSAISVLVRQVCDWGPTIPEYVTYFRADKYHQFGNQTPYSHHCNTYFSYDSHSYDNYQEVNE